MIECREDNVDGSFHPFELDWFITFHNHSPSNTIVEKCPI